MLGVIRSLICAIKWFIKLTILTIFYPVYYYLDLIYRIIVPAAKKSLDGEIFLITGSAGGLGREVAIQLAAKYPLLTLVLWDWNAKENKKVAETAKKFGGKIFSYKVDISNPQQVEKTAKLVEQEVGHVTILWNNGAIFHPKDLLSADPEDLEKTIQINLISHFWTLRAFLPHMIKNNRGHIVTTASIGSFLGGRNGAAYFASKFGIRGYLETLQDELRLHPEKPDKIKLTTIFPCLFKTRLTAGVTVKIYGKENFGLLEVENVAEQVISAVERNQEILVLPRYAELLILYKSCAPSGLFQKISNALYEIEYGGKTQ